MTDEWMIPRGSDVSLQRLQVVVDIFNLHTLHNKNYSFWNQPISAHMVYIWFTETMAKLHTCDHVVPRVWAGRLELGYRS